MDQRLLRTSKVTNTRVTSVTTTVTKVVEVSTKSKVKSSVKPISYEKKSTKPIVRSPMRSNLTAVVQKRPSPQSTLSLKTTSSMNSSSSNNSSTFTAKGTISPPRKNQTRLSTTNKSLSSSTLKPSSSMLGSTNNSLSSSTLKPSSSKFNDTNECTCHSISQFSYGAGRKTYVEPNTEEAINYSSIDFPRASSTHIYDENTKQLGHSKGLYDSHYFPNISKIDRDNSKNTRVNLQCTCDH